jgi:hypothetical protein
MPDNQIFFPKANPLIFYKVGRANLQKYFTKHFDEWMFEERLYDWQAALDYSQVWQVEDIVPLQFESTMDPIIVKLMDSRGNIVIELPALIGLPNIFLPGTFSFEIAMSLASVPTGCYYFQIEAGAGDDKVYYVTGNQYISVEPIRNSILFEYWHSEKFHQDIVWATGIKLQYRTMGHFGWRDFARDDEAYRNQRYAPTLISSKTAEQAELYCGDEYGIPDDHYGIINRIWSCNNVLIDGKPFGLAPGSKVEPIIIDSEYQKRGFKYTIEDGLNRNSRVYSQTQDSNKKLITTIIVAAKVFGDTGNQGSSNTVPNYRIEQ